jgi:hypothetical protein
MGGRQWKSDLEAQLVIQNMSLTDDGTEASDLLETLIETALEELGGDGKDLTLGITGLRMLSFSREYRYVVFDEDGNGSLFMPQAVIRIKIETRS